MFPQACERDRSLVWDFMQRKVGVNYRRFGTSCRFRLQGSSIPVTFYKQRYINFNHEDVNILLDIVSILMYS